MRWYWQLIHTIAIGVTLLVVATSAMAQQDMFQALREASRPYWRNVADEPKMLFYFVDSPVINAYARDGNIYITQGILNNLRNDDEAAFVLSHEIAHAARRHNTKAIKFEIEADLIGLCIMHQAGYNSAVVVPLLRRLTNIWAEKAFSVTGITQMVQRIMYMKKRDVLSYCRNEGE